MKKNKIFSVQTSQCKKIVYILGIKFTFTDIKGLYQQNKQLMEELKQIKSMSTSAQIDKLYSQNEKILTYLEYFKARVKLKQNNNVNIPAQCCGLGTCFGMARVKLGDLRRCWDGKPYKLSECSPYKYIVSKDIKIYEKYIQKQIDRGYRSKEEGWTINKFLKLEKSIQENGYNPSEACIAIDENNQIIDGLHRSSILLKQYGPDYEIRVIRVQKTK